MYLKLKQYIKNNKHLLLIFCTTSFSMLIYNVVFCNPVVLMTLLPSVANKFIDKAFEVTPYFADKAIAATPYVAYGTGWIIVGSGLTLASIKTLEYGYNWRYIANQTTNSIPIVGWAASCIQKGYAGITGSKVEPVEYTYFLPKIASVLGDPKFFTKKIVFDLNTQNVKVTKDMDMVREVEREVFKFVDRVEKQIEYIERPVYRSIPEYVDKPVYIPVIEYRDRENLLSLGEQVNQLSYTTAESNLLKIGFANGSQQLKEELRTFVEKENNQHPTSIVEYLAYEDDMYFQSTYKNGLSATLHQHDDFAYPLLKQLLLTDTQSCTVIQIGYIQNSFLQGGGVSIDFENCFIGDSATGILQLLFDQGCAGPGLTLLINKMSAIQELQDKQTLLVLNLQEQIHQNLLRKEKCDHGIQTANFDLNETIYERISSFLDVRDETSFSIASNEARSLSFNNMQLQSYAKPQVSVTTQTQETSIETQADFSIIESVAGISTVNSTLFQQMGTFFGTVLVGAIAHDFQTVDLVARSLLGFIHIPEYNQAFIAATNMSIADLQMTYNFSEENARMAYTSIEYANTIRTTGSLPSDLSSQLSDSNEYFDQAQRASNAWGVKEYLLFTSVLVLAGGTLYFMYQSIKTGTPIENSGIQSVSPSVDAWKNTLINKVNKL